MKKEPILNVSLDRVWVEKEVVAPGTVKRSYFQERNERLERVYRHPVPPQSGPGPLGAHRKSECCDGREQTGV